MRQVFTTLGKVPRGLFQALSEGDHDADGHEDHALEFGIILFLFILIIYIVVGSWMEKMHFKFGHETGMIIVVGIVISLIFRSVDKLELRQDIESFPDSLFFNVFLPLIIFATGYNMRRKNFFENFTNISKFGLLGTFLTFVFYSLMTWMLF